MNSCSVPERIGVEFRLQFRHPQSFGTSIRGSDIHDFFENSDFDRFWNVILKWSFLYGRAERLGGPENGKTANEIQFSFNFFMHFERVKRSKIISIITFRNRLGMSRAFA